MNSNGRLVSTRQGQGYLPPGHQPSKLTGKQRDEIAYRRMDGDVTARELAAEYGVSVGTIRNISPKERP